MRDLFHIEPGMWQAWFDPRDGNTYSSLITAAVFEMNDGCRYLGAWRERPTKEQIEDVLKMQNGDFSALQN